jgi:hypothetical protein
MCHQEGLWERCEPFLLEKYINALQIRSEASNFGTLETWSPSDSRCQQTIVDKVVWLENRCVMQVIESSNNNGCCQQGLSSSKSLD